MNKELTIIIAIGLLWIAFWNITRWVWTATAPEVNVSDKQSIACLEGGGKPFYNDFNQFVRCFNNLHE